MDLVVAYRCYPGISKNPKYWKSSKLEMIKGGLKSMVNCFKDLNVKYYIIADGIPKEWEKDIKNVLSGNSYEYIHTKGIGNIGTWFMQIDLLLNQEESEIIYFAEDDYLYNIYDSIGVKDGINLLKSDKADFISLFDHAGYYKKDMHKYKKNYYIGTNRVWKTESSTCLTFMTTKKNLKETKHVFEIYNKRGGFDYTIWLILTKKNIFRFFDLDRDNKLGLPQKNANFIQKALKNFPLQLIILFSAWIYGWRNIIFGKKYKLFISTPSICTHLESDDISPIVNWDNIYNSINKDYN